MTPLSPPGPRRIHQRGLTAFPNEILGNILGSLVPHDAPHDKKWLLNAMLSCQVLNNAGGRIMVKDFKNSYATDKEMPRTVGRISKFARLIFHFRPELASSVKTLMLGSFSTAASYRIGRTKYPPLKPTEAELNSYRLVVRKIYTEKGNIAYELLRLVMMGVLANGYEDGFVALMLSACSGLRELGIGCPVQPDMVTNIMWTVPGVQQFLHEALCHESSMTPDLASLYLECEAPSGDNEHPKTMLWPNGIDPRSRDNLNLAIPFFHMTRARRYECVLANYQGSHVLDVAKCLPARTSSVEHIILRQSRLTPAAARGIVASCASLRTFEYVRGDHWPDVDKDVTPRQLMMALSLHSKSLESLVVDFDGTTRPDFLWETNQPERLYAGRCLGYMPNLTHLVVGLSIVFGWAHHHPAEIFGGIIAEIDPALAGVTGDLSYLLCPFPPSLTDLTIFSCEKLLVRKLKTLIRAAERSQCRSSLKNMMLLFPQCPSAAELDVDKSCLNIKVMEQTPMMRTFDRCSAPPNDSSWTLDLPDDQGPVANLCTPIYSSAVRDAWLKWRYKCIVEANSQDGVVSFPEACNGSGQNGVQSGHRVVELPPDVDMYGADEGADNDEGGVSLGADDDDRMTLHVATTHALAHRPLDANYRTKRNFFRTKRNSKRTQKGESDIMHDTAFGRLDKGVTMTYFRLAQHETHNITICTG